MKRGMVIAFALVLVLIAAFAAYGQLSPKAAQKQQASVESARTSANKALADYGDVRIYDADGNARSLVELCEGAPAIVNYWATWCPNCVEEMDDYQKLFEKYGDEVRFVMVDATDGKRETREKADAYIADHDYGFPVYYDAEQSMGMAFAIEYLSTTIVVDRDGTIVSNASGRIDYTAIDQLLGKLIA